MTALSSPSASTAHRINRLSLLSALSSCLSTKQAKKSGSTQVRQDPFAGVTSTEELQQEKSSIPSPTYSIPNLTSVMREEKAKKEFDGGGPW